MSVPRKRQNGPKTSSAPSSVQWTTPRLRNLRKSRSTTTRPVIRWACPLPEETYTSKVGRYCVRSSKRWFTWNHRYTRTRSFGESGRSGGSEEQDHEFEELSSEESRLLRGNARIRVRGPFLWRTGQEGIPVRFRDTDPPPDISLICDEEIAEAVKVVLESQFATAKDELVVKVARLLGIGSTRHNVASRLGRVIGDLANEGELVLDAADGRLHLAGSGG